MTNSVVSLSHIDALVTAGLKLAHPKMPLSWIDPKAVNRRSAPGCKIESPRRVLTIETAGTVGSMLLAENQRNANDFHETACWEEIYVFLEFPGDPDPLVILKAIGTYQIHAGGFNHKWPKTEAKQFCDSLRDLCIRSLPGYNTVAWELISSKRPAYHPESP